MKILHLILLVSAFGLWGGCTGGGLGSRESGTTEAQPQQQEGRQAPIFMQDSDITVSVSVGGREYQSTVVRQPDKELPMVRNEQGQQYVDNRIALTLRDGSRVVASKTFTKADFVSYLDAGFREYAILEGLVFDKVEGGHILYAASVAYPETDLYVPFQITVTTAGNISIAKSDIMDEYEATPDSVSNQ